MCVCQIDVLVAVEHSAVLEPRADEHRTPHEIGQPSDPAHASEREYPVMIAPALPYVERVEHVRIAQRELTRRQRQVIERRSAREHGEDPVPPAQGIEGRHRACCLREALVRPHDARNLRRLECLVELDDRVDAV